jgi:uncharacterized membrane protein YgdD (TMEM256/DUF423 family)
MLFAGSLSAGISVALGAFGAHGLSSRLSPDMLQIWETGARYQMYHALALLAVSWVCTRLPASSLAGWAGILFIVGTVLFCGSLYVLAVSGRLWLGAITPLGGLAFLAGWICLALSAVWG